MRHDNLPDLPPYQRQLVYQFRLLLPDLRDAFLNREGIGPILHAYGQDRTFLHDLEKLGAIDYIVKESSSWRYFVWTWPQDDEALITKLLLLPKFAKPRQRLTRAGAYFRKAKKSRRCDRCEHIIRPGMTYLNIPAKRVGFAPERVCNACRQIIDEPEHERELERLRKSLTDLHLCWPEDLEPMARHLDRVGILLTEVSEHRPRAPLSVLASDLCEVATWLDSAARVLEPHRERVLRPIAKQEDDDREPIIADYLPKYQDGSEAEISRAERLLAIMARKDSAKVLHSGLLQATEWLKKLRQTLTERRLGIDPNAA